VISYRLSRANAPWLRVRLQALAWASAHTQLAQIESRLTEFTQLHQIADFLQFLQGEEEAVRRATATRREATPAAHEQRAPDGLRVEQESFLEALSVLIGSKTGRKPN